jgi:hypothetical protein
MIGRMTRERGIETNSHTPKAIKRTKKVLIRVDIMMIKEGMMNTDAEMKINVLITTGMKDTGSDPTRKIVTTSTTIIADTGMYIRVIGDHGINGTGMLMNIRRFTDTAIITVKRPI